MPKTNIIANADNGRNKIPVFVQRANHHIDKMQSGEDLPRRPLAKMMNKDLDIHPPDAEMLLCIICRSRTDMYMKKGKGGGSFKK